MCGFLAPAPLTVAVHPVQSAAITTSAGHLELSQALPAEYMGTKHRSLQVISHGGTRGAAACFRQSVSRIILQDVPNQRRECAIVKAGGRRASTLCRTGMLVKCCRKHHHWAVRRGYVPLGAASNVPIRQNSVSGPEGSEYMMRL